VTLDLGKVVSRAFSITWRHRWLWLLGVFGGGGLGGRASFNSGPTPGNGGDLARFLGEHVGLVLAAIGLLLVIALVSFLVSCVAIPASIWAGLQLDAGRQTGLGAAWRAGRHRFWAYFRLALLKALLGFAVLSVFGILVAVGVAVYAAGGPGTLPLLVPVGVLLVFALVATVAVLTLGLLWSDRLLVILGLGAVDSMRAGWQLFRHNKLNTVVLAVVVGAIGLGISIAVAVAAAVVSIPGIVILVVYFTGSGGSSLLAIGGFTWVILLGGGTLLVGAGFVGAFSQVAFALAARDLAINDRLPTLPDVIGYEPGMAPLTPTLAPAT
jgi:hypothetical protein